MADKLSRYCNYYPLVISRSRTLSPLAKACWVELYTEGRNKNGVLSCTLSAGYLQEVLGSNSCSVSRTKAHLSKLSLVNFLKPNKYEMSQHLTPEQVLMLLPTKIDGPQLRERVLTLVELYPELGLNRETYFSNKPIENLNSTELFKTGGLIDRWRTVLFEAKHLVANATWVKLR